MEKIVKLLFYFVICLFLCVIVEGFFLYRLSQEIHSDYFENLNERLDIDSKISSLSDSLEDLRRSIDYSINDMLREHDKSLDNIQSDVIPAINSKIREHDWLLDKLRR